MISYLLFNDKTYFAHYFRKAKSYECRTFTKKTFKRGLTDFVIIPYLFRSLFHYDKNLRMSHILFKQGIFLILRRSSALENCSAVWLSHNNNPNFFFVCVVLSVKEMDFDISGPHRDVVVLVVHSLLAPLYERCSSSNSSLWSDRPSNPSCKSECSQLSVESIESQQRVSRRK